MTHRKDSCDLWEEETAYSSEHNQSHEAGQAQERQLMTHHK